VCKKTSETHAGQDPVRGLFSAPRGAVVLDRGPVHTRASSSRTLRGTETGNIGERSDTAMEQMLSYDCVLCVI
jgi:hypothetical protein